MTINFGSTFKLPFFFKALDQSSSREFPTELDFHLVLNSEMKLIQQKSYQELNDNLNEVYCLGSLIEGSTSSESGGPYTEKLISYIFEHFEQVAKSRVLEIGFGSGVILKQLKDKGIKCLCGVEPGDHALVSGLEGIRLIHDFFPSKKLKEKFDLIFSFGILEHIENPEDFLRDQILHLNPGGKIIFGVPNCEPCILAGDISMLVHEHFSYFSQEAIVLMAKKIGVSIEDITIIEGALVVTIIKAAVKAPLYPKYSDIEYATFATKVSKKISTLERIFSEYQCQDIAIYNPVRALNVLHLAQYRSLRLVDDNSELHGKFLPGLTQKIESLKEVISAPPKCIIIFSRTFGQRIFEKCSQYNELAHTNIYKIEDLD